MGRGASPARAETRLPSWREAARPVALASAPPVALALGIDALLKTRADDIGSMGLVSALPAEFYLALALLTTAFLAELFVTRSIRPVVLMAHVVVFAVLLHGAATIVEPLPRFIPAWLHVGFTDYISRTGKTLPELDARFSWPGFFALAAMATRAAGLPDAMPLLEWTPVVFNLLFGAVVYRLARATSLDARGGWLAVWLFFPANWVGQDYFAPQGLNYLFYLIILGVLLVWFRPSRLERVRRRVRRRAESNAPPTPRRPPRPRIMRLVGLPPAPMRHEPEPAAASRAALAGLTGVVLVLFTASTASHQLTPMAILVSVAALVVARRCSIRTLPILLLVILLGYISYLTVTYWSGHLHEMVGSFGRVGNTVNASVSERVKGDRGHLIVLQVRQLLTASVWAMAALGAWRLMRRGRGDFAFLVLAGAPFLLLFVQSYGGEVFLRIYTFALPFMVVLVAAMIMPIWPPRHPAVTAALACVLSVALTIAFFIARYGNESFERVLPADAEAVAWLYSNAPPGVTFVAVTSNVPWRAQDLEQYKYTPLGEDLGPDSLATIEAAMESNPRGAYLIMTKGQYVMGESFFGKPPGWGERVEREVAGSGRFRVVYSREGAHIFVLATPGRGNR